MNREVKNLEEAMKVLKALNVEWATMEKVEYCVWKKGMGFFDNNFCRVAFYNVLSDLLTIE
jgi:anthranilate phosphoribosyltransferase